MSQYYTKNRKEGWNYGGKNWKLSRCIKECLETDTVPEGGEDCDWCAYWNARGEFEKGN